MISEGRRQPLTMLVKRPIFWYLLLACIFLSVTDFELWHRLRLRHLQTIQVLITDRKDPYDNIRYYDYLTRIDQRDSDAFVELGNNYLTIGNTKDACRAFSQALKGLSSDSAERKAIDNICHDSMRRSGSL